jgi:hypothetical protein
MSAQEQNPGRWKAFTSLDWYDGTIEFLFRFVAKTSEPLLAAGIVYSAADVLSKGHLGSTNATMDNLWAISQALAIESSGGVVLVYGLESLKAKDHVKAWLYLILSALLAITGGVMLFMQLAGLENQQMDSPLMRGLFALRCVVSVGYIYLCRTKAISFRNFDKEQPAAPIAPAPPVQQAEAIDYQRLAQELAPLLQAVRTTIIEEVKASIAAPSPVPLIRAGESATFQNQAPFVLLEGERHIEAPASQRQQEEPAPPAEVGASESAPPSSARTSATQEERLERAYQELLQEHPTRRISGRILSERAKVHRTTCNQWLKVNYPDEEERGTTTENSSENEGDQEPKFGAEMSATPKPEPAPPEETGAPLFSATSEPEPAPPTEASASEAAPLFSATSEPESHETGVSESYDSSDE